MTARGKTAARYMLADVEAGRAFFSTRLVVRSKDVGR
jgi:hypothetical protein